MTAPPLDVAAQDPDALEAFVGKWRARWPEWSVAEVFVPPGQRAIARAWAALQQELTDAAWGGGDPRPGEAKLAWWQEELHGWSQGRRRHPLGIALQRETAPWAELAAALPTLRESRDRAGDGDGAFTQLRPVAAAACRVEHALFALGGDEGAPGNAPASVIAACWLQSRVARDAEAAAPLDVLARAGEADAGALWGNELLEAWPPDPGGIRPRRLWAAIARARLRQGGAGRPLPPWKTLWVCWHAARN